MLLIKYLLSKSSRLLKTHLNQKDNKTGFTKALSHELSKQNYLLALKQEF